MTPALLRRLSIAGILCVAAWLFWPRSVDPALTRAEENGYRAAKKAAVHRRLAAEKLRALEVAKLATDARFDALRRRVSVPPVILPTDTVVLDSLPRPVIGDVQESDTLVAVRLVRLRWQAFVDSLNLDLGALRASVLMERAQAGAAITHLQAALAAQDTVILGRDATIQRLRKPWYRRASRGVEHAVAGLACGGAGYLLGGPLIGVGAGVVCAAVAGVVR